MKTKLKSLLGLLAIVFSSPAMFANAEPAEPDKEAANEPAPPGPGNQHTIPMTGGTFDFRAMVMRLLGCPDGCADTMINERYTSAMECQPDSSMKANAEAFEKAQADLLAANAKLKDRTPRLIKLCGQELNIDLTDAEFGVVDKAITAANASVTTAEGTAANARQSLVKLASSVLIKEGRITKAEQAEIEKELASPQFANAEAFEGKLEELSKRASAFGTTSSVFEMLGKLGEPVNSKNTANSASAEMLRLVGVEQAANASLDYTKAWANVAATDKGKALIEQMKGPAAPPSPTK